jgi:DNA-binding MarR family transcriptional regulator
MHPTHEDLSFEDVARLRLVLLRLTRRLRQNRSGMTQSQLSALASVKRVGPISIGELAAIENVQPPSVSRIVGALEGEGWIKRVTDANDGRVALVQTTSKGEQELERLRADRDVWLTRQTAALAPGDRRLLRAAIPALERLLALEEKTEQGPGANVERLV